MHCAPTTNDSLDFCTYVAGFWMKPLMVQDQFKYFNHSVNIDCALSISNIKYQYLDFPKKSVCGFVKFEKR